MSKTASLPDLLEVCMQDLYAARRLAAERLPCIAGEAGQKLAPVIEALVGELDGEARAMEQTGFDLSGDPNLWMAGILDDAERDTRSIEPGSLLDIALVGAVRKAVAADAVSLETAVEVAGACGEQRLGGRLQAMRERCRRSDAQLHAMLAELT